MVLEFVNLFNFVRSKQKFDADDKNDKLNRSITVIILIIVTAFLTSKALFSNYIKCNGEQHEIANKMDYVESFCYVKEVFQPYDFRDQNPKANSSNTNFTFYAWMPLFISLIALWYYFPYMLWKMFLRGNMFNHVPIDVNGIVTTLDGTSIQDEVSSKKIDSISKYLDRVFMVNNYNLVYKNEICEENTKRTIYKNTKRSNKFSTNPIKSFIPLIYKFLFVKLVYLAVSLLVFTLVDFLFNFKSSFHYYGVKKLSHYLGHNVSVNDYLSVDYFPRVIFCEILSRDDIKNVRNSVYQCVLPANVFIEKIFVFLWAWFVLIAFLNLLSLIKWLNLLIFRGAYVKNALKWPLNEFYEPNKDLFNSFVNEYLTSEGFLAIVLIQSNTNSWNSRLILRSLWTMYVMRVRGDCEDFESSSRLVISTSSPLIQSENECKNKFNSNESTIPIKRHE